MEEYPIVVDVDADEPQRFKDLWFDDGNLVLRAEGNMYRVYRGILAARSPVFKDMFALPQPADAEVIEGCPVVRLPDPALEVTVFLRAIFDPVFFEPYPAATNFHIVAGILRLSNKYAVDYLRHRALVHFSSAYFTTLREWQASGEESSPWKRPSWHSSAPLSVYIVSIALAREVEVPWILPFAFYCLAVECAHNVNSALGHFYHNGRTSTLSNADQARLLQGCIPQVTATTSVVRFLHFPAAVAGCTGGQKCSLERLRAMERVQDDRDSGEYQCQPLSIWDEVDWDSLACCRPCMKALKLRHKKDRQEFWEQLPETYDLPGWEQLEEMKRGALGSAIN
ncbi:hypothetical protein B0H10DRAFT_1774514 [Mycena sp. CBHHK59/15]|nr:hypothetical protein B0H10DRAFT_1774514 [Mycena sp. CBHHK59/15]